jgi:hypothetical protein
MSGVIVFEGRRFLSIETPTNGDCGVWAVRPCLREALDFIPLTIAETRLLLVATMAHDDLRGQLDTDLRTTPKITDSFETRLKKQETRDKQLAKWRKPGVYLPNQMLVLAVHRITGMSVRIIERILDNTTRVESIESFMFAPADKPVSHCNFFFHKDQNAIEQLLEVARLNPDEKRQLIVNGHFTFLLPID